MIDETTLVERARSGDLEAFRQIVEQNRELVYRTAFDMLGTREDAEDIAQDAFLRAHRSLAGFRHDAKLSTWLYRIVINVCHDHMSRRSYRTTKPSDDLDTLSSGTPLFHDGQDISPARKAESSVIGAHVERALGVLTPRERAVFVLRHYQDLPMKEIGSILRITDGTVRSTLFRALQRLQKELSHYRADLGLRETQ